jgi:hypothetical protein
MVTKLNVITVGGIVVAVGIISAILIGGVVVDIVVTGMTSFAGVQ